MGLRRGLKLAGLALRAAVGLLDDRAAEAAFGLLRTGGGPPDRGVKGSLEAYSTYPWIHGVVSRIASATAAVEWQLFIAKPRNGGRARRDVTLQRASAPCRKALIAKQTEAGELQPVTDHPFLTILNNANSYHLGLTLRSLTQIYLDLVGEAFWIKERDGLGTPVAAWPVPPHWIREVPTPGRRRYLLSWRGLHEEIPDTEILWFLQPDPVNPYGRGIGTARAVADEAEIFEYASKHMRQFFLNSARPDLLVFPKGEQPLREPEVRRLEDDWLSRHQGFWRSFKPFFASREIGVHEFKQNFRELQMVELQQFARDTTLQVFGLPPELLGVIENANRATIQSASFLFANWVLVPRLEFQRAVFQERLVPEFDERLIVDYVSPVQEDRDFALEAAKVAPWALTVDEWRALMAREPLPDGRGQVHVLPFTLQALGDLGGGLPPEGRGLGASLARMSDEELRALEALTAKACGVEGSWGDLPVRWEW